MPSPALRPLGSTGLRVAPLILGGHVFGWTVDEAASHRILDAFVDRGFNAIDTADIYGWFWMGVAGLSEYLIGTWIAGSGKRDRVLLATKVGGPMGPVLKGLARNHVITSVEGSLKRLRTDRIDLYQSHFDDAGVPQEETAEAFDLLVKQGKVRAIGTSNFTPERLRGALAASRSRGLAPYQTFQPIYNLCERAKFEAELEGICRENSLAVISYSPLACGFLSGKYRSEADFASSKRGSDAKKFFGERGFRVLAAVDEVARRHGAKPSQIALAWLLARPSVVAPITSATSVEQLEELIGATELKLSGEDLGLLDSASS